MKRTISFLLAVGAVLSTGATAGASGLDTLLDFAGTDVANPRYNLILDSGKLYGTTARGVEEGGTIFSVDTDGSNFTLLHQFFSAADSTRSSPATEAVWDRAIREPASVVLAFCTRTGKSHSRMVW